MSLITGPEPREREREAARVTPALYQLFPSYPGAAVDPDGRDVDMFAPENIQKSVVDSLTEFVRIYSVATRSPERRARALEILRELLGNARRHRQTVTGFRPSAAGLRQDDWLAIIGVGEKTRIQMTIDASGGDTRFVIGEAQFVNELGRRHDTRQTGDGTVPLGGAAPPFLAASRPVCVTDDDLDILELRDRLLVGIGGFHGLLPRVNLVQRLVTRHLDPGSRGRVWGRRMPGARSWNPPIAGLEEKQY